MRVMIWGDMEGVTGVVSWEHVGSGMALYEEGRRLYSEDMNAAVRGCKAAGASEIVAIDSHGGAYPSGRGFMSLVLEQMQPGATYVLGHPWTRYVEPLRQGFDAVMVVGAHGMAGSAGVLSHTVSASTWRQARINGKPAGEVAILAGVAGHWNVPLIFVSGDDVVCEEARSLLGPGLATAEVKKALGRFSARHLAPADARALITETVSDILQHQSRWPAPVQYDAPVTFEIELAHPDHVAGYSGRAGVTLVDSRTVRTTGDTFWDAWDAMWPG